MMKGAIKNSHTSDGVNSGRSEELESFFKTLYVYFYDY